MVEGYNGLLTATVFLPAVGAVGLLLLVKGDKNVRNFAALIALADMVLSLIVFGYFDRGDGADRFQFVDRITWIPDVGLNAEFLLTVDGLSAPLVALTGLLGMCAVLASWHVGLRVKEYFIWLLVLQTAVMGCIHLYGLAAFLPLLGVRTGPYVYADFGVGQRTERILGHEVPDLHHSRQRVYAGGDCCRLPSS